jgi:hypothetical protein
MQSRIVLTPQWHKIRPPSLEVLQHRCGWPGQIGGGAAAFAVVASVPGGLGFAVGSASACLASFWCRRSPLYPRPQSLASDESLSIATKIHTQLKVHSANTPSLRTKASRRVTAAGD